MASEKQLDVDTLDVVPYPCIPEETPVDTYPTIDDPPSKQNSVPKDTNPQTKTSSSSTTSPPPPPSSFSSSTFRSQTTQSQQPAYVQMVVPEDNTPQPRVTPQPAYRVKQLQLRQLRKTSASASSSSSETATATATTTATATAEKIKHRLRLLTKWLVTHDDLITHPSRDHYTINDYLADGHTFHAVVRKLEIDSLKDIMLVGITPPLSEDLWRTLADNYGLVYRHLYAHFGLLNIVDYKRAGITLPLLISNMHVSLDTLLDDARFDATSINTYPIEHWIDAGFALKHAQRLGPALATYVHPHKLRLLGVRHIDLPLINANEKDIMASWRIDREMLLGYMFAAGPYIINVNNIPLFVDLDNNGDGETTSQGNIIHVKAGYYQHAVCKRCHPDLL